MVTQLCLSPATGLVLVAGALFLVANLLTGAANLAMRTLDVGPARSFAVLAAYLAAVLAVVVAAFEASLQPGKRHNCC